MYNQNNSNMIEKKLMIGGELIAARKDMRMSRQELCRESGLFPNTSLDIEKGQTNYSINALLTYADAVGLEVKLVKKMEG